MARRLRLAAQLLAVATVASLLALLGWRVVMQNDGGVGEDLYRGKTPPAPNFTLPRLDRPGTLTLSSLKGSAVVLNFWASNCPPCRKEAPLLEAAWRKYRTDGVVMLGIATKDFDGEAKRFMRKYGMTYPNVYDGAGRTWEPYGITALPETFFIGRNGKVIARIVGAIGEDEVEELEGYIEMALSA